MSIVIGGLQKSTLLDFPDKISTIVFMQGCNFRCGYCHNPELCQRIAEPVLTVPAFLEFLSTRQGKLDGVVISGGEPTIQEDLPNFIKKIKKLGFAVKLDTNGSNPDMLEQIIKDNLADYVAMDIKAPLEKYETITNTKVNKKKILNSISLLINSEIDYEFRTTIVRSQLMPKDFIKIGDLIQGGKRYYLQKFKASKTIDKNFMQAKTYSDEELLVLAEELRLKINEVLIR